MVLIGLSLLLYPTLSDYLMRLHFRRVISQYQNVVESLDEETYSQIIADAQDYNKRLASSGGFMGVRTESELAEYNSLLNVAGTGIMGYVEIRKLNISLPLYHGTEEDVLQVGIGHLDATSLPVGGETTHSIVSGHRGLPSAKLFTNIDQLGVGDTFNLRILKEVLTYQVDRILTVLPDEVDTLRLEWGADYCTLVTCTPYGVNTHRLLVRGHRIPTPEEEKVSLIEKDGMRLLGMDVSFVLPIAIAILLLTVIPVVLLRRKKKKGKSKSINDNKQQN